MMDSLVSLGGVVGFLQTLNLLVLGWVLRVLTKHTESYAAEKGKNLATREDIQEITRKIEDVKHQYNTLLQLQSQHHQLRMAALDRRLQAHQEAYTLWWKVFGAVHDPQRIGPAVMECQEWWTKNCLYLNAEARDAFSVAYHAAHNHKDLVKSGDRDALKYNWELIQNAGPKIAEALALPALRDEYRPIPP